MSIASTGEAAPPRRRWIFIVPIAAFVLIAIGFCLGLTINPQILPSALIDEPAPQFDLPPLPGQQHGFSTADLKGHVSLVNTFASWCAPCRMEHPILNKLAETKQVPIYGIDYKDQGEAGAKWLETLGNPYTKVGADTGRVGIDWGVYGVPETFVIDRNGRIRYKHVGPLSEADIQQKLLPMIARLKQ